MQSRGCVVVVTYLLTYDCGLWIVGRETLMMLTLMWAGTF